MYNVSASYQENYANGPDAKFLPGAKFPKIKYTEKPGYEFLGIPLHIPFGVAAGPLLNASYVKTVLDAGFCLPVYKTVRSRAWDCNNWPNILAIRSKNQALFSDKINEVIGVPFQEEDYISKRLSISNSFGVPSQPIEIWKKDFQSLSHYKKNIGSHVVLSFQGSYENQLTAKEAKVAFYKDIEKTVKLVSESLNSCGFSIMEINLSCPNEAHAPLYKDLPSAIEAVKCARQVISEQNSNIKLVAKIGTLSSEETNLFLSESAGILDALSAINTVSSNIRTPGGKIALGSGSLSGGVCGSLIFEQGLSMLSLLAETRAKLGIKKNELGLIGVGGVVSTKEFQSYLSAGADVVQAATGMMWNLDLASEIAHSLQVPFEKRTEDQS
jgi:dihydroorotate dehydrogenase (NAD+) catalytic subunit